MGVEIDLQSETPIYVQIYNQIKRDIASGSLEPGDQLPPSRKLADQLGVNFNTVARAYRILDQAGLVSLQHGRGTFVLPCPSPEREGQVRKEALESLIERFLEQAARLAHSPEEVAQLVQRGLQIWEIDRRSSSLDQESA